MILSQAARATHMNTSQFVLQVSLDAAQSILTEQTVFTLTPEQWDAFQKRLDEPPRVIPALQKLHAEMTNG
jgi:uncharacterized protein (DUF1778 family)